jgi:uncharacterized membrane protein YbhN (UPF0104 family)
MTALTLVAAYLLMSQLLDVGLDTIADALSEASLGWVAVAFVTGQLPRVAQALATMGASSHPLALGPTTALQMSVTFINLAVPSTAARAAMVVRFYQKQGVPPAQALTFGTLDGISGFIVQIAILVLTLGFGLASLDLSLDRPDDGGNSAGGLLVVVILAVAAGLIALFVVPSLRAYVTRAAGLVRDALRGIGSIRRLGLLFGGNLLAELLFAFTLGLCTRAYGYDISLVNLLAVNVIVSLFAGLLPIPGGIGVTEGGLTTGLMAAGMPQDIALAAVLTYRMITYYLPPVWGYFAMRWLRKNDYL